MKKQRGHRILSFTKLTSPPIDMISCAWKDWFEDFKSLRKGKGIRSLNNLPHWIPFLFLLLSATLFKFLENKPCWTGTQLQVCMDGRLEGQAHVDCGPLALCLHIESWPFVLGAYFKTGVVSDFMTF